MWNTNVLGTNVAFKDINTFNMVQAETFALLDSISQNLKFVSKETDGKFSSNILALSVKMSERAKAVKSLQDHVVQFLSSNTKSGDQTKARVAFGKVLDEREKIVMDWAEQMKELAASL